MFHPDYIIVSLLAVFGMLRIYHDYQLQSWGYLWAFFFLLDCCHKFFNNGIMSSKYMDSLVALLWLADFFGKKKWKKSFPSLSCQPKSHMALTSHSPWGRAHTQICPGSWIHTLHVCIRVLARPSSRQRRESVLGKLTHAGLGPKLTSVPGRRQRGNAAAPSAWRAHTWGSRGEQDRGLAEDFPTRVGFFVAYCCQAFLW